MARGDGLREPVVATDPRSEELEELQFTLGEGPSVESGSSHGPVLVADLSSAESGRRWPMFARAAVERGIGSMSSLPVGMGAIRLGVLNVYRPGTGLLSGSDLADALAYADGVLVIAQAHREGAVDSLTHVWDGGVLERRAGVHQAVGMVSVQLGVDLGDALARLRAYAYVTDRRLSDVAADVVARRLAFHPDSGIGVDTGGDGGG
jgi:hypothetical protein